MSDVEGTCASCVWWTDITSQYDDLMMHPEFEASATWDEEDGWWVRKHEPMPGRWGQCTKVDHLDPQTRESQFYVTDASAYRATLHTRETFGCNQWEG